MAALIFIDTSAIVAILCAEDDAPQFAAAIEAARTRITSPHVRLEACMVLSTRLNRPPEDVQEDFGALMTAANVQIVPLTDAMAREAVAAFGRYGKGKGHPAQLNLADCLSYAVSKTLSAPILFKGRDFSATDLEIAVR